MMKKLAPLLMVVAVVGCTKKESPSGADAPGAPTAVNAVATPDEKPGAKGFAEGRCWDMVNPTDLTWPDGCKGAATTSQMCTMVIAALTDDEKKQYEAWVAAGKPETPCQKDGT